MKTKLFMAKRGWQLTAALGLILSTPLVIGAQPQATPGQFDFSGPIEKFSLDTCTAPFSALKSQSSYASDAQGKALTCTATIVLNGQAITLPANTVITYPATFLSPYETFAYNPLCAADVACTETGMAIKDANRLPSNANPAHYEASVQGNVIYDATGKATYVAGLVSISQQDLNSGDGFINYIDYQTGELFVGGDLGQANGHRVRINDPFGRFGRRTGPLGDTVDTQDVRFAVDDGNPTIIAGTGYPMCIPRFAPSATSSDPLCPENNRPVGGVTGHITSFSMPPAANVVDPLIALPAGFPIRASGADPTQQAPLEVGDYIHYEGTLAVDTSSYLSAHTIAANVGIFTTPGTDPAYLTQEVTIVGVGVTNAFAAPAEGRELFKVVGFTTDVARPIDTGMVQVDPCNGVEGFNRIVTLFPNGSSLDPTGAALANAPLGRFRSVFLKGTALGIPMRPAAKEIRTEIVGSKQLLAANGLITGQYTAPVSEYVFAENLGFGGLPIVPNNFEDFPFLSLGHGPWDLYDPYAGALGGLNLSLASSPIQGQLTPWPGNPTASVSCAAGAQPAPPVIAASDLLVAGGASVLLNATATTASPGAILKSFSWALLSATQANATLSPLSANDTKALVKVFPIGTPIPNTASLSFTAPSFSTSVVLSFQITVTDSNNSISNKIVKVTVNQAKAVDTLTITAVPTYRTKDGSWSVLVSGSDPTAVVSMQAFDQNNILVQAKTTMSQPTPGTAAWTYTGRNTYKPTPTALTVIITSSKGGSVGNTAVAIRTN